FNQRESAKSNSFEAPGNSRDQWIVAEFATHFLAQSERYIARLVRILHGDQMDVPLEIAAVDVLHVGQWIEAKRADTRFFAVCSERRAEIASGRKDDRRATFLFAVRHSNHGDQRLECAGRGVCRFIENVNINTFVFGQKKYPLTLSLR